MGNKFFQPFTKKTNYDKYQLSLLRWARQARAKQPYKTSIFCLKVFNYLPVTENLVKNRTFTAFWGSSDLIDPMKKRH